MILSPTHSCLWFWPQLVVRLCCSLLTSFHLSVQHDLLPHLVVPQSQFSFQYNPQLAATLWAVLLVLAMLAHIAAPCVDAASLLLCVFLEGVE